MQYKFILISRCTNTKVPAGYIDLSKSFFCKAARRAPVYAFMLSLFTGKLVKLPAHPLKIL